MIGVLGGMGPEATALFYTKLIKFTPATKDQDHIPTLIYSNPRIPNRTDSILSHQHTRIRKALQTSAKLLEQAGCSIIVMPCNTAHYYVKSILDVITIPFLNMIDLTVESISAKPNLRKVGLLATKGTIESGLYSRSLATQNIETILPSSSEQDVISHAILSVKSGQLSSHETRALQQVMTSLETQGAQSFILGCTELPLALKNINTTSCIDPLDSLAQATITYARRQFNASD